MTDASGPTKRQIALAAVRSLSIGLGLTILYYVVPIDGLGRIGTAIGLGLTLTIFLTALALEIRSIVTARYPISRAVEAMATLLPLLLLLFAALYYAIELQTPTAFTTAFDRTGSLYFTITTFATVGYGDITPVTNLARVVAMVQMIVDLAVLGVVVRLVFSAASRGRERQTSERDQDAG